MWRSVKYTYVEIDVMIKFKVGGRGQVAVAFLCRKKRYVRRKLICIVLQVADVPDSFV